MSSGPTRFPVLSLASAATALALSGCSSSDETAPSPDLGIVEVRQLDLPSGDAYLSPDGSRIATYTDRQLCVFTSEGEKVRCASRPIDLDPNSVQWNPDGSRLLYTEDFWADTEARAGTRQEPDVWSFRVQSGEATNLTDDGVDPGDLDLRNQPKNGQNVDTLPMWIHDSTIRFLRSDDGWNTVDVMQLPATGGDPERVGTLPVEFPPQSVAYSRNGERAAYERQLRHHDIALSNLQGRDLQSLTDASTQYTVSFAADGSDLLAVPYSSNFDPRQASTTSFDPPVALTAHDGKLTELDESVQWAAWQPRGDALVYAEFDERDGALEFPLRIVSEVTDVGDDARELSDRSFLPPYRHARLRAPVWSEQNTLLLREQTGDDEAAHPYVLVRLSRE